MRDPDAFKRYQKRWWVDRQRGIDRSYADSTEAAQFLKFQTDTSSVPSPLQGTSASTRS